ncbi:MAG TPA: CAP domain-containing protein [Solirubrobacteraceae bacterium]|nr:CAP domain-containing protein [Solirubrobacteraceae bacterium]
MARARLTTLLTIAAFLLATATAAATCPNANLTPSPDNIEQVRTAVLCLIDQERQAHGEGALAVNAKLMRAAQRHSREMADEDFFAHVSPDGLTPLERIRASGFIPSAQDGYVVGENIAWGTLWLATPRTIVGAWMESPGHRANILDGAYRETGVGVEPRAPASLDEGQAGALYTQDFGTVVPPGHSSRRAVAGSTPSAPGRARHAARHGGHRRSPARAGRITSTAGNQGERKRSRRHHGSSRRQSRHRHRIRARHRPRHRRAARRARRKRADQRSRRRHRAADRR